MDILALATVVGIFVVLALLDVVSPARVFPKMPFWRLKGIAFFVLTLGLSMTLPLLWDEWLGRYRLIDATGLGHVGGFIVGMLAFDLTSYLWHRALHRIPFLWRSHQMHHSAERIDVFGAYYFHPIDTIGFAFAASLALVLGVGITGEAALAVSLVMTFLSLFQHANVRTPAWLGWLIQRPENHAHHHERGVHAYNYGNLSIWDMVFRTFRNPATWNGQAGFYEGASRRVADMLVGKDVTDASEAITLPGTSTSRV